MPESSKVTTTRDSDPFARAMMFLVRKHHLLERGVITQAQLDHLLDFPPEKPEDEEARQTHYLICKANDPETRIEDIE